MTSSCSDMTPSVSDSILSASTRSVSARCSVSTSYAVNSISGGDNAVVLLELVDLFDDLVDVDVVVSNVV